LSRYLLAEIMTEKRKHTKIKERDKNNKSWNLMREEKKC